MTISRRAAFSGAAALTFTSGTLRSAFASAVRNAAPARRHSIAAPAMQRFLELLIHHDEAGHAPFKAELAIPSSDTAWYAKDTLDLTTYQSTNHVYKKRGYRLKRISVFKTRQGVRYSACWQLASGPEWHTVHGMIRSRFDEKTADYARKGFRMIHLDARSRYAAIWERADAVDQKIFSALSATQYEQLLADLSAQDYRPMRLSGGVADGAERFAAIFEKSDGRAWQARHRMTAQDLHKATKQMQAQGYWLTDASGHMLDGKPSFTGIWEKA